MDGLQVCWVHQEVEDESEDDEDEETQLLPGSLRPFEAAGFHSSRQFAAVAAQERSEEAIWSSGLPPQSASSSSEETHPHRNKQIHSCITGKTRSVPSSRQHTASPFLSPSSTSLSSSVAPPDSSFSSSLSSPRLSSSPVALSCEASSSAFPSEASSSSAFPSEASSSAFPSEASSSSVFHSEASSSASSSSTLSSPPPLLSASSPLLKSACRSEPRVLFPSSVLPAVRLPPLPSDRLSKVCSLVSQLSDSSTTTAASRSPEQEVSPPCPPAFRRLATSAYNSYLPSSFSISALSRCSSASPPSSSSSHTSSSFSSSSSSSLSSSSSFSSTSSSLSSSFSATSFSTRSSSFSVHGGSLCSPSPLGCAGFSESLCLSPRCSREPPGSELFNLLDDLESGVVCEFDPPSPNKALREKGEDSSPFSSDVSSPSSPLKSFLSSPRLRHSASTALPRDSLRSSAASPSSPLQAPSSYSSLSSSSASSSSSSFASSSPPTLSPSSSSSPPSSSASSVSFSTPSSSSPNSRFSSSFPRGFSSPSTVSECHPVSTALSCPRSASSASAAATNSVLPLSENARSLFVSPSLSDLADVMAVDFEDVDSGPAPSCSSSSCSSRASFSFSSLSHSSPSPLPASAYCSRPVLRHSAKDTAERRRKDAAESELRRGEDDRTEPHKTWMPERGDAVKEANRTPVQELRHSAEAHQPDTEEISSHFLAFFDDSIPLNHGVHPAEHADRGLTPTSKPEMKSLPDVASSSPSPTPLSFTTAGFRFASGREVTVSEEARRKAREMLQLEAAESEVREKAEQGAGGSMRRDEAGRTDGHETQGIGTTAGFRFASGREVTVSEEARRKAREMLQLEAAESEVREQAEHGAGGLMRRDEAGRTDGHETQGICTTAGFRFASGREVTVSEEARRKAREMLQLEAAESEVREKGEQGAGGSMRRDEAGRTDGHETQGICTTAGFRFASGREVTVSEEARRKAREMLQLEAAESEVREQGEQGAGGSMRRDEAGRTDGHETQGIGTTAGFRFASGREVTVSEEARRKAREMLQLEAAESEVREQAEHGAGGSMRRDEAGRTDGHETQGICTTAGFRFASGREVTVSEEARRKAREMLQLEAAESEAREQGEQGAGGSMRRDEAGRTDGHETQGIGTTAGFRFASGREVTVSEEARRKAREMLQLEAAESEVREKGEQGAGGSMRRDEAGRTDGHETQGIGTTAGFRFASGREVTVSEEARRKAREMLQLEAAESEVREKGEHGAGGSMRRDEAGRTDGHETQGIGTTAGFRFASGREVTVSEEARRKAREMLQLEADESEAREQGEQGAGGSMRRDEAGRTDGHETQGIGTTAGFRFASGREVTVSEEARRKAREMLQLEADESEAREQGEQGAGGSMRRDEAGRTDGHETQGIGTTAGFRFASGREVTVSEEARRKAREMLQLEAAESEAREQGEQGAGGSMRRDEAGRTDGHETQGIGTTAGFRFASGREVTVSEEARRKAREMLQLEAAESEVREQGEQGAGGSMRRDEAGRTDGHETQGIGTTAGFRFASGREVTVSEEARRKAREMLQLEADESEVREKGEQGAGGSMRRDEAGRTDGHETQGIGTTAGFRFASGREVTVSEEARRKAREMLQLEATGREEVCQQTDVANGLGNEVGFTMTGVCTPPGALVSCHPISGSVACIPSVGSPSPSKLFASFAVSSCCATVAGIGPGSVPLVSVLGGCGDCGADLGERDPGRVTGPGTGEETDREPSASHFVRMQSTAQPSCVTNHDEARKFQSSVPSEATECSQVSLPSPSSALRSAPSLSDSSAPAGQPASEVENRSSSSLSSRARPPSLRRRGLTSGLLGVPRLAASGVGAQDARAAVPRDRRHFKAPRRNSQTASLGGQRPRVQERTREDLVKAKQEDASRSEGSGEKEEKQYCFPEAQTNVLRASGTHFSSLFSVSTEPKDLSFPSSACSSSLPQVSDASPLYQNMLVIRRLWELHARRFSICLSPLSRSADPTARVSSSPYPQSPSSLWPPAPLPAAVSPDSRDACERRNFQFSFLDRGLWLVCLPEHLHKRTVPLFCGSLEAARDFLLLSCTARGDECIEDSSGWSRGASSGCRAREDNAGTRAEDGSADGDSGGRSMLVGGVEEFSRMVGTYLQWKREVKRESPSTASSALLEKTRNGKKRRETPELRGNRNRFTRAWVAHHYSLLCLRAAQRWTRSFALSVASYRHESHHRNSCTGSSSTLSHSFLRHPPLQTSAVSLQGPRDAVAPAPPFSSPSRPSACPASVQSFLGPPRPPSPLRLLRALLCRVEAEEEGRRSVLRQVCEGDLSPATPMVLEVLCPPFCSEDPLSLRVSDGWYVVKARVVDPSLAVVLRRIFQRRDNRSHAAQTPHSPPFPRFSFRRIFVQGASLSGLSEPCCPLDLPSQACLLLHASTCRPLFSPLPLLSSPASSLPSFLMATDSKAPLPSAPSPVASCPLFSSLLFAPEWLGKGCASSLASLRGSAFPLGRWLSGRGERKQRTGGREEKEEEERAVPQAVKSLRRGVGGEIPVVDVILLRRGPLLFRVRREVPKPGGSGRPLETREGSRENEHPPENDVGDSEPRETKTVLMTEAEYRAWFQREQETLQRKREEELVLLQEKLEEVRRKTESKKAKRRRTPCLQTREEDDGDGETAESGGKDKTSLRKEAPQREEEGHTCEERDCEATLSEEEAEDELRDLERQLTRLEELWRVDRENLAKKGQSQIDLLVVDSLFLHKLSALALMAFANVATSASAPSHVKASVNCVSFLDASGPPSRSSLCGVDQVAVASSSDPRCVASASSNVPPTVSSSLAPPLAPLPVPPAAASSSSSPSFVSCSSSSNSSSPLAASTSVSASGVSLAPSFGVSQTDIENALDSALEEETETKHHTSTSSSMVSSPSLRASRSTVSPQSSAPAAPFEFAVANSGCRSRRPSDSQQHASEAPHSRTERRDEAKLPTHAKSPPATYARDRSVNSKPCEDLLSLLRLCGCLRPRKVEEETDLRTVAGLARLFRQSLACITLSGDPATEEETPFHELQEGERVKISNLACSPAASVYSTRQRRHGQEPDRGGGGGGTGKWTDEWSELNAAEEERRLGVIDCHGNQRLVRLHGTKRTAFQIVRLAPGSALSPHPSGSHPAVSSPHVSAFFPSPPSSSPPSSSRYPSCSSRPFASPSLSRSPPSSSLVRLLPVCTAGSGGSRPLPFAVPLSVLSTSLRASLAAFSSALSPLRSPSSSAALSPSAGASAASGAAERENCQLGEGARSNLFADGPTPGAEREGERREEANDGEPSEELDEAEGGKKRQQGRGRRRAPSSSVKGALDATAQKRQKRQLAELPRHCCAAAKDFEQTERGASPSGSDLGCKEKRERLTTRLSAKRSTCRPPDSGPGAETKEESKRRNAEDKGTKVESAFLLSALSQWLLPLSSLDVLLGLCHLPLFSQAHRLACLLKEADREREREQEVLQREEKEASTATEGRRLRERGELTLRPRKEMFFRGEAANHVRERDERRAQDRGRWPHFPETQVLNERLSKSGEEGKENVWQQLADAESVIAKGILKGQASESMQCLQRHGLKGSEQTESCVSPPDSLYRFTAPPISIGILPAVAYDLVGVLLLLEDHQVSPLLGSYSADSAQTCSAFVGSERHASPSGLVAFLWTSTDQICCIRVKPSRNFSDFSVNSGSHSRLEAPSSSSSSSSSSLASASRSGREATGCSASREAPAGGCPFLLRYRQMLLGAAGRRNAGTTEGVKARQGVTAERAEGLQRWWMFQTEERGKVESGIKEKKHSLTGSVCVSSISSSVAASLSPGFLSLRWALFQNVEFQGRDPNLGIFNFSASPRLLHLASGPLHAPLPSKVSPVFSTSSAYTNSLPFSRNSSSRQFPSSSLPRSSCLNSPFASDSPPPCSTSSSSAAGASSSSVLASSLCPAASPADAHSGLHPYCTEEEEREGEDKSESRDTGGSDSDFGDRKARKKNGVREGREHGVTETSQRVSGQREGARGEKQSGRRPPDSAMRQEDPRKNMRLREERNESEMRNEVDAPASKGSDKEGEREEGDRKVKRQRTTPKRPSCRVEGKEERSITVCAVGMNDCLSEDRTVSTKRAAKPRNQRGEAADFISFETAYGDWKETACFSDRHEFEKANRFSFLQDEICDLFRFLGAPEAAPASSDRRGIDRAKPLLHNDRARLDIQSADQPGGRSEGDKQRPPSDENRPLDRNWDPRCSGKEQLVRGRGALNDWDRAIRGEARELEEERGEKTENGREGRGEAAESDRQGDHVEQCMRSCGGDTALSRLLLALEKVASAVGARRL